MDIVERLHALYPTLQDPAVLERFSAALSAIYPEGEATLETCEQAVQIASALQILGAIMLVERRSRAEQARCRTASARRARSQKDASAIHRQQPANLRSR